MEVDDVGGVASRGVTVERRADSIDQEAMRRRLSAG